VKNVISWYLKRRRSPFYPGAAVTYMFETCDEWDPIFPSCG